MNAKRHLLASVAAIALLCSASRAFAQAATLPEQVLQYARQLQQLQQEIQTATNTLNFYLVSLKNLEQLPVSEYRDVTGDIAAIQGLINQATLLQGWSKQMLTNLSSANGYPDSVLGAANYEVIFAREFQALSLAMNQAAQTLDAQGPQLTADAATLARLQAEAMADDGHTKSLETLAGISATSASMTQKSQQTTAATMQALLTARTAEADRQSLLDGWNHIHLYNMQYGACGALAQTGYTSTACSGIGN